MNKAYRLIWSKAKDAWVIAAEIVKGNGGPPPVTVCAVVMAASLALTAVGAYALPSAPTVVSGNVNFGTTGNTLTVTNSPNSIINWQAFSIAANETVRFNQQNALSAILNRVTGADPSQILGALQSNGRVFLINPNGIIFGQGSRIDVGGLVASSLGISNQDFLAGNYRFSGDANSGAVINQGAITTMAGGMVWLISPNVENSGVITSPNGSVMLAAGQSVHMVDPLRPEIAVVVSAPADQAVNIGEVLVQGGSAGIYGSLVSQQGVVRADSVVAGENGRIFLKGTSGTTLTAGSVTTANGVDGGSVIIQSTNGDALVSGNISVSGSEGAGGSVQILGQRVALTGATIDASGTTGGGSILVGGDYQGKNPDVQNAKATYVSKDSVITADGLFKGDGGKVVVWSDGSTKAYGAISARGGAQGGKGGLIETSGHFLDVSGISVDASARKGNAGNWLLDPFDVEIVDTATINFDAAANPWVPNGSASTVLASDITAALDNATPTDVTITTGTSGSEQGNITVNAQINWASGSGLTLTADGSVFVNAPISGGGPLSITGKGSTGGYSTGVQINQLLSAASVTIKGWGGNGSGSGNDGYHGVEIKNNGSTYLGSIYSTGNIQITGYGGRGSDGSNYGGSGGHGINLNFSGSSTGISSNGGAINLTGFGGTGGTGNNGGSGGNGINLYMNSRATNGIYSSAGTITLNGTGGTGGTGGGGYYGGKGGHGINVSLAGNSGHGIYSYGSNIQMVGHGGRGGDASYGGAGGNGITVDMNSSRYAIAALNGGSAQINGYGGQGGVGSNYSGGAGGHGVSLSRSGTSATNSIYSYGGTINIVGHGGQAGSGQGYGYYGGDGINISSSSGGRSVKTNRDIQLTGYGGQGGYGVRGGHGIKVSQNSFGDEIYSSGGNVQMTGHGGLGGGGSYGFGGDGINLFGRGASIVSAYGTATLRGYGGASVNGSGGYGIYFNGNGDRAVQSYGGSIALKGIGGIGNGVQQIGLYDSWSGGEGAVLAPTVTVETEGGLYLTGTVQSISLSNSNRGDVYFSTPNSWYSSDFAVQVTNTAPDRGFSVYSNSGYTLTVSGITTSNGFVNVQNSSDIIFTGAINAGTGDVTVTSSSGAISGLAGGSSINATSANLSAANGIDLTSVVTALDVYNSGPGAVTLTNTGALTVNRLVNIQGSITLDNTGAVTIAVGDTMSGGTNGFGGGVYAGYNIFSVPSVNTAGCDVTITAHSPLTVNGTVAATGNVSLTAGSSGSTADNLVINSTGGVFGGNNVTFAAGNAVTFNAPAVNGNGTYSGVPPANGSVFYAMQVAGGTFNSSSGLNPPAPPPGQPPSTVLDVSSFMNDTISTMRRESTDLTDEDNEIYQGGHHDGAGNVTYCN